VNTELIGKVIAKCPICLGNGLVPSGFYSTTQVDEQGNLLWVSGSTESETCRSCDGRGYIILEEGGWSYEPRRTN